MPFQGLPIGNGITLQVYGPGDTCHEYDCTAKLDRDHSEGWFIKFSMILCPAHHPDVDKASYD